ncbi:MAG TPA: amidase domain-containing protein, partial [Anaerolineales bacterium]|nr:amidase domain-containing protein [Anaerolineales bacterium]
MKSKKIVHHSINLVVATALLLGSFQPAVAAVPQVAMPTANASVWWQNLLTWLGLSQPSDNTLWVEGSDENAALAPQPYQPGTVKGIYQSENELHPVFLPIVLNQAAETEAPTASPTPTASEEYQPTETPTTTATQENIVKGARPGTKNEIAPDFQARVSTANWVEKDLGYQVYISFPNEDDLNISQPVPTRKIYEFETASTTVTVITEQTIAEFNTLENELKASDVSKQVPVTIKGIPVTRMIDSGTCDSIYLELGLSWIHFIETPKGDTCSNEILPQIFGTLHITINIDESLESLLSPNMGRATSAQPIHGKPGLLLPYFSALLAGSYDRVAVVSYVTTYWNQCNNANGTYLINCSDHYDGANFVANALAAGNFSNLDAGTHFVNPVSTGYSDVALSNDQQSYMSSIKASIGMTSADLGQNQPSPSGLQTGDVMFISANGGSSFGHSAIVVGFSGTTAQIGLHSVYWAGTWQYGKINIDYDAITVTGGANHLYRFYLVPNGSSGGPTPTTDPNTTPMATNTPAPTATPSAVDPKLWVGLNVVRNTELENTSVNFNFVARNTDAYYGTKSFQLRVRIGSTILNTVACNNIPAEGDPNINPSPANCYYSADYTFPSAANYVACAEININGSWVAISEETSRPVNDCANFSILDKDDVQVALTQPLTLDFELLPHTGGTNTAKFLAAHLNISGAGQTVSEYYRARVVDPNDNSQIFSQTFPEVGAITLSPGASYSYAQSQYFDISGVYEVLAEHKVLGTWFSLLGNNRALFRVLFPPPPVEDTTSGDGDNEVDNSQDPVNTLTGNYHSKLTDMLETTPGLGMQVERWYNALTAPNVNGPFGKGTSWEYGMYVTWRTDKTALVKFGDGEVSYYIGQGDLSSMAGTYLREGQYSDGELVRNADDTAYLLMPDQTRYDFAADGKLTRISNLYPAEINLTYTAGKLSSITHSNGVVWTVTWSGNTIRHISSSSGQAVSYTYDTDGNPNTLDVATLPDGSQYTYFYDGNARVTEARDPLGKPYVRNQYDSQGRIDKQWDVANNPTTFSYSTDASGNRVMSYTNGAGETLSNTYQKVDDYNYKWQSQTDELNNSESFTRDGKGNILTRTDKRGKTWTYSYDANDNLTAEVDPYGVKTAYQYDALNNLVKMTTDDGTANAAVWEYGYQAGSNRLLWEKNPLDGVRSYQYNADGSLFTMTDEAGATTTYNAYNSFGQVTQMTDALGNVTRMEYDNLGNRTRFVDAKGNVAEFEYDARRRLLESTDPMGGKTTFDYDEMGNLLSVTDPKGNVRRWEYDDHSRVKTEFDGRGNPTHYTYDALGRRKTVTNALNQTTTFEYDEVGRLFKTIFPDGSSSTSIQQSYYPNGLLKEETNQLGQVTTHYEYDDAGRQSEVWKFCLAGAPLCSGGWVKSYTTYDRLGRVETTTDGRGAVTRFTYDKLNRLVTTTSAFGTAWAQTTRYSYDVVGRQIQVQTVLGVTQTEYNLLGWVTKTTNALGHYTQTTYDALGNPVQQYDERGNITRYGYDGNNRVTARTDAAGNRWISNYDANGNLLNSIDPLGRITRSEYDANNQLVRSTDALGRQTRYAYDELNRQVWVTDASGHRTSRTTYDNMGRVIAQTDALNRTTRMTYDVLGRTLTTTTPLGFVTRNTYD